jgi:hypothetical protein
MVDVPNDLVKYIALDPGETTGWAKFGAEGNILAYGQFKQHEQLQWLKNNIHSDLQLVIIEDYKNYAWQKQKKWSRNQTSKNIGSIETACGLLGVKSYLQPANVKSIGYKYAGMDGPPSNHAISHQFDAVAHGYYYLRTCGILKPTIPGE